MFTVMVKLSTSYFGVQKGEIIYLYYLIATHFQFNYYSPEL